MLKYINLSEKTLIHHHLFVILSISLIVKTEINHLRFLFIEYKFVYSSKVFE